MQGAGVMVSGPHVGHDNITDGLRSTTDRFTCTDTPYRVHAPAQSDVTDLPLVIVIVRILSTIWSIA